jgi:hypothetical protein
MAGPRSNYEDEILAAMQSLQRYSPAIPGGAPLIHRFDDPNLNAWQRAMAAAVASKSGEENEALPDPNAPRMTDPLDRSRYLGS